MLTWSAIKKEREICSIIGRYSLMTHVPMFFIAKQIPCGVCIFPSPTFPLPAFLLRARIAPAQLVTLPPSCTLSRLLLHLPPCRLCLPAPPAAYVSRLCPPSPAFAGGRGHRGTRFMARSGTRDATAPVRPSATSPPQQFPGVPMSSFANPSVPPYYFPGAPTSSSAYPSMPQQLYPSAPSSSSTNLCMNQW
jgi:hypothetical protein